MSPIPRRPNVRNTINNVYTAQLTRLRLFLFLKTQDRRRRTRNESQVSFASNAHYRRRLSDSLHDTGISKFFSGRGWVRQRYRQRVKNEDGRSPIHLSLYGIFITIFNQPGLLQYSNANSPWFYENAQYVSDLPSVYRPGTYGVVENTFYNSELDGIYQTKGIYSCGRWQHEQSSTGFFEGPHTIFTIFSHFSYH